MNERLKKEFDGFMFSGRNMSEKEFDRKSDEFLASKTEDEKAILSDYFMEYVANKWQQYKEVTTEISMLEQLGGIEDYINMAKLSKEHFGKTKSWIYQRLHGYSIHGKPAKFTNAEKKKLSDALMHLSEDIKTVALKIA